MKINLTVLAYIVSEFFFWSGWSLIVPIFSVFVIKEIPGSSLQIATSAYTVHLLVRVVFELLSGNLFAKKTDIFKFGITILGMYITSGAYMLFAIFNNQTWIHIAYAIAGIGVGIATPVKGSLFSTNLDKGKETLQWSIYDTVTLLGMAMAASAGSFLVLRYGFRVVFLVAAILNFLGTAPYVLRVIHLLDQKHNFRFFGNKT